MSLVKVCIDSEELLEMLENRCEVWESSKDNKDLYRKMYEHYLEGGAWEGAEFSPMVVVDNDVINFCTILDNTDEDFYEVLNLYRDDCYDISCNDLKSGNRYSYIEAVSDDEDRILVRY